MNWSTHPDAKQCFIDHLEMDDNLCLLALSDSEPCGFLVGTLLKPEPYRNSTLIAELEIMFVDDSCRSQGIGKKLVEVFTEWARSHNCRRTRVVVRSANSGAIKFYKNNNFIDFTNTLEAEI